MPGSRPPLPDRFVSPDVPGILLPVFWPADALQSPTKMDDTVHGGGEAAVPVIMDFVTHAPGKHLVVLHLMGSHIEYAAQYPKARRHFDSPDSSYLSPFSGDDKSLLPTFTTFHAAIRGTLPAFPRGAFWRRRVKFSAMRSKNQVGSRHSSSQSLWFFPWEKVISCRFIPG